MRHVRLFQILLLTVLCLTISGLAEAGKGGHPEQFPYPDDRAVYEDPKKGCEIEAYENGNFTVFFPAIGAATISCDPGVEAVIYDPTTMSNSAKKLLSTQTVYIDLIINQCSSFQVPISSMTAAADAKKAAVTVNISDSSLQNEIYGDASIRPQGGVNYESALINAGFSLRNGSWTATCSGRRVLKY